MAMARAEMELRRTDNPADSKNADIIRELRKHRGEDVGDETRPAVLQLIEAEQAALKVFFGKEVAVTAPPSMLFETLRIAETAGLGGILEPIYFPEITFKQTDEYPGWKIKPEKWYWKKISAGKISKDAAGLGGFWTLFDKSRRPNYDGGGQMFQEDSLATILSQAKEEDRILGVRGVPKGSRFAVSTDEQDQIVFPKLAEILQLVEDVTIVRRPTLVEFNFAGNLRYSHLGEANTWEWLHDKFAGGYRLIGGLSERGGLAGVYRDWPSDHGADVAFRPLIVFLPNT